MIFQGLNLNVIIFIILLSLVIFLYFCDPEIFLSRIVIRIYKIKFFIRIRFGKSGKEYKEKYHKLNITIQFCEESISKYVNKRNLSTLKDDDIINELLCIYRELLNMQELLFLQLL